MTRHRAAKYLYDMLRAANLLAEFTAGKSFRDYEQSPLLRSGVERQFEIIGEAMAQLARLAPEVAERVPQYRQIIDFRNLLIHGYTSIDARVVWDILQHDLPALRDRVSDLLEEAAGQS